MIGWVRLYRDILNHWIFSDGKKLKWWLIILLTVNYQDNKVLIGNKLYECKRGESIRSLRSWAKMFNTTPETVRHFFSLLEENEMIVIKSLGISTHLKVCNYDVYQGDLDAYKTQDDTVNRQESTTNNNDNNDKNVKKKRNFIPPTLDEVISYFEKNNYPKELAERAYKYYNEGEWKDSNGKPVSNWKQKVIANWFKDENRKSQQEVITYNSGPGK